MITRTSAYVTSDNQTFAELDAAIGHEIVLMFEVSTDAKNEVWKSSEMAAWLVAHRDRVVDLLTTTATSKSRARKVNGGSKKRTPKPADNAPELPGTSARAAHIAAAVNRELQDGKQ